MTRKQDPDAAARAVLDSVIEQPAVWAAMCSMLNARALRDGLVRIRREQGLTQADLGERMGVKQPTISQFETERYPDPQIGTLQRYARAVGCQLELGVLLPIEEPREETS